MALRKEKTYDTVTEELIAPQFQDEVQMQIAADGMAHILDKLTDLYTNPPEATVRELVSNALDARILIPEADRKPIEITTPTVLSPTLVVKDFGTGMSLDTVQKIYSQYGASTKKKDFSQIGAFGLGAKAPLSYCNEFTGITVHNGIKTSFIISRGEKGNYVKILDSVKTTDPIGTEFRVPVNDKDIHEFAKIIKKYAKYNFAKTMLIDGDTPEVLPNFVDFGTVKLSGIDCNVKIRTNNANPLMNIYDDHPVKIMLVLEGWPYHNPEQTLYYSDTAVIIEIKPGLVDFTSSRDAIVNNERVKEVIRETILQIRNTISTRFLHMLKNLTKKEFYKILHTFWDKNYNGEARFIGRFNLPIEKVKSEFFSLKDFSENEVFPMYNVVLKSSSRYGSKLKFSVNEKSELVKRSPAPSSVGKGISQINEMLKNTVELSTTMNLNHYILMSETHQSGNIVLVTGVNAENIRKFCNTRSKVQNEIYNNASILLLKDGVDAEKAKELLEEYMDNKVDIYSIDEIIDMAKSTSVGKKSEKEPQVNYFKMEIESIDEINTYRNLRFLSYPYQATWEELKEKHEDFVILLMNKDQDALQIRKTLRGAYNAGIKIEKVIILYKQFSMAFIEELEEDYTLIVTPNYTTKSKTANAILDKYRYSSDTLTDVEIKNHSSVDIIKVLLGNSSINIGSIKKIANLFKKSSFKMPEWFNIAEKLSNPTQNDLMAFNYCEDFQKQLLEDNDILFIENINKLFNKIYGYNFGYGIVQTCKNNPDLWMFVMLMNLDHLENLTQSQIDVVCQSIAKIANELTA